MQFSLGGLLLLTSVVAAAVATLLAWPRWGAIIGPALLMVTLVLTLVSFFFRRRRFGLVVFGVSSSMFVATCLLYLSFGPAAWAHARFLSPKIALPASSWTKSNEFCADAFNHIYQPIATNAIFTPEPIRSFAMSYVAWWMPNGTEFCDWGDGIGWHRNPVTYTVIHY
ncbi:hypothetical protein [Crateriforma spongiae]|uniref:hypothetical protein n=1 Tax=Crateriforma spongiae TaxID=2724528 RepID=UPI0014488737|nr:hypothetical protein [Crateriforma spongiae]